MKPFTKSSQNYKLKELLDYIKKIRENSFSCWSDGQELGYVTACKTIEKKIQDIMQDEF